MRAPPAECNSAIRRSQGTELATSYWFRVRMCFLRDAHTGASCRVQLGDPPLPGHRARYKLLV